MRKIICDNCKWDGQNFKCEKNRFLLLCERGKSNVKNIMLKNVNGKPKFECKKIGISVLLFFNEKRCVKKYEECEINAK